MIFKELLLKRMAGGALALAALVAANPATAGQLRVEGRAGLGWANGGGTKATMGAAVGYDMSVTALGTGVFAGVEQSIDKQAKDGDARWGTSARLGVKVLALGSLYGVVGYHYGGAYESTSAGVGYAKSLGPVFARVEYRRMLNQGVRSNADRLLLGFGVSF
jgi:hypothetical protein